MVHARPDCRGARDWRAGGDRTGSYFNVVIYANHMLRASYPAMQKVALEILKNGRTYESEKSIMSISNILDLIPGTK